MKSFFILLILNLFISAILFAQTGKNSLVVGFQFRIYDNSYNNKTDVTLDINNNKNSSFNILSNIGYFIFTDFEIGPNYSYTNEVYKNESSINLYSYTSKNKSTFTTQIIGIYSKFHKSIYENFGLLSELDLGYGILKNDISRSQLTANNPTNNIISFEHQTGSTLNINLNLGFEYYIKKRLGIELKVDMFNLAKGKINKKLTYDVAPANMTATESNQTISEIEFCQPAIYIGLKFNLTVKPDEK